MTTTYLAGKPEALTSYANQRGLAARDLGPDVLCAHGQRLADGCGSCRRSGCVLLPADPEAPAEALITTVGRIEQMLRVHGIYPLRNPQRMNCLGGSRGLHVQADDGGFLLTPYHPSAERLMGYYEDAALIMREAGWSVVGTLRPEGAGVMPALWIWR